MKNEIEIENQIDNLLFDVASDDDGSNLIAGVYGGRLYTSSDSGANWTERQPVGNADKDWYIEDMINIYSRNEWDEYLTEKIHSKKINGGDLSEISDFLISQAIFLVELAEYIDYRGGAGCGDHGHEEAIKKAETKKKRVCKALGYSCP